MTLPQIEILSMTDRRIESKSEWWSQDGEARTEFQWAMHKYCGGPEPDANQNSAQSLRDHMKALRKHYTGSEELKAD